MHDWEHLPQLCADLFKLLSEVLPGYAEILNAHKEASDCMVIDLPLTAPVKAAAVTQGSSSMDFEPRPPLLPLTVPVKAAGTTQGSSNMDVDPRPPLCIILPLQKIVPSAPTMIPTKCVPPSVLSLKASRKQSKPEQENICS
jgi:hypothetical protein